MFIFVDDIKLMTMRRAFFFALSLSLLILGCESREDCPSLGSYEKEIEFFKEFYTKRVAWMTKALNSL